MLLSEIKNKRILLRLDLNLPMRNGIVIDDTRIKLHLPTIETLLNNQNKIIIISHFGRPKEGQFSKEFSLCNILSALKNFFDVEFIDELDIDAIKRKIKALKCNIILLENIRFFSGETSNSQELAANLSSLADVYCNDAFSASHRNHASIVAIKKFLPSCYGILMEKEIKNLNLLKTPISRSLAIIGGSKISTKLALIENLAQKFDKVFIGGAMANNFLKVKGIDIKKSLYEENFLFETEACIKKFNNKIILPIDYNMQDERIYDIGLETINYLKSIITDSRFVVWNGPLGMYEVKPYNYGSEEIAKHINELSHLGKLSSILGGGDTLAVIKDFKQKYFTYVSSSGGAFLEYLEKFSLVGL